MAEIDFGNAERALAVANTPMFLLRKIAADEALISAILRRNSRKAIRSLLLRSLGSKAASLRAAVRPYVYAVALTRAGGIADFDGINLSDFPKYKWMPIIVDALRKTHSISHVYSNAVTVLNENQVSINPANSIKRATMNATMQ